MAVAGEEEQARLPIPTKALAEMGAAVPEAVFTQVEHTMEQMGAMGLPTRVVAVAAEEAAEANIPTAMAAMAAAAS